jgi:small subunit ribosomal protein S20
MPITTSAKKAVRQNARRRKGNIIYKKNIKSLMKDIKSLVSQKKNADALKLLPQIYKALDKAAKRGVIKKNNASRNKERITKLINKK